MKNLKERVKICLSTSMIEPNALIDTLVWNSASIECEGQPQTMTALYHAGQRVTLSLGTNTSRSPARAYEYTSASLMMVEAGEE